jgi:hypothetical protein
VTLGIIRPLLIVTLTPEKYILDSNETMNLEIEVLDLITEQLLAFADIKIFSDNLNLKISPIIGSTGINGKLIVQITAPIVANFTEMIIFVEVTKANYTTNLTQFKIIINPPPEPKPPEKKFNLHLTDEDITFSMKSIYENDEIKIYALITNTGDFESSAFRIKIYLNDHHLLGDLNLSGLAKEDFILIEVPWIPKIGKNVIKVEIIALEPQLESDDSDNIAFKVINILETPKEKDKDDIDDGGGDGKNGDVVDDIDDPDDINNGTGDGKGKDDQDKSNDTTYPDDEDIKKDEKKKDNEFEKPILIGGFDLIDLTIIILICIIIIFAAHLLITAKYRYYASESKSVPSSTLLEISENEQEPIEVEPIEDESIIFLDYEEIPEAIILNIGSDELEEYEIEVMEVES